MSGQFLSEVLTTQYHEKRYETGSYVVVFICSIKLQWRIGLKVILIGLVC